MSFSWLAGHKIRIMSWSTFVLSIPSDVTSFHEMMWTKIYKNDILRFTSPTLWVRFSILPLALTSIFVWRVKASHSLQNKGAFGSKEHLLQRLGQFVGRFGHILKSKLNWLVVCLAIWKRYGSNFESTPIWFKVKMFETTNHCDVSRSVDLRPCNPESTVPASTLSTAQAGRPDWNSQHCYIYIYIYMYIYLFFF